MSYLSNDTLEKLTNDMWNFVVEPKIDDLTERLIRYGYLVTMTQVIDDVIVISDITESVRKIEDDDHCW